MLRAFKQMKVVNLLWTAVYPGRSENENVISMRAEWEKDEKFNISNWGKDALRNNFSGKWNLFSPLPLKSKTSNES